MIIIFYSSILYLAITSVNWFNFTRYPLAYLGTSTYSTMYYVNGTFLTGALLAAFSIIIVVSTEKKLSPFFLTLSSIGLMGAGVFTLVLNESFGLNQFFSAVFYLFLFLSIMLMSLELHNDGVKDILISFTIVIFIISILVFILSIMLGGNAIYELIFIYSCFIWWGWLGLRIVF
jgi:hypothetical membrane protein